VPLSLGKRRDVPPARDEAGACPGGGGLSSAELPFKNKPSRGQHASGGGCEALANLASRSPHVEGSEPKQKGKCHHAWRDLQLAFYSLALGQLLLNRGPEVERRALPGPGIM